MKNEFKVIAQIIQNNKRVLDIGCGDGTLMEYLKINQQNDVRGLEPQKDLVQKCISKGLSVIEGDAEKELAQFPQKSFDYVILSQTLQAFFNPEEVLNQLLRIGKQTIVSIPNFGFWRVRIHLLIKRIFPNYKKSEKMVIWKTKGEIPVFVSNYHYWIDCYFLWEIPVQPRRNINW